MWHSTKWWTAIAPSGRCFSELRRSGSTGDWLEAEVGAELAASRDEVFAYEERPLVTSESTRNNPTSVAPLGIVQFIETVHPIGYVSCATVGVVTNKYVIRARLPATKFSINTWSQIPDIIKK